MVLFPPLYSKKNVAIAFCIAIVFLILATTLILFIFPAIAKQQLQTNLEIINGTEQFDRFVKLPFPLQFKIYVFNVENPNDILNGSKPILREVGPYIYKEYREKTILNIDESNGTITYSEIQRYEFSRNDSGRLSDNDKITILNPVYFSLLQIAENLNQLGKMVNSCTKTILGKYDSPFIEIKVKDLLFEGVEFCHPIDETAPFTCIVIKELACAKAAEQRNVEVTPQNTNKFSLFNYKNGKSDGIYTINSGINDITNLGEIISWNNSTTIKIWPKGSSCAKIHGTDTTIYAPQIEKWQKLSTFSTDVCRTAEVSFLRESSHEKIPVYIFGTDKTTFNPPKINGTESCYCSKSTKGLNGEESCFLDGTFDAWPCIGSPAIVSFPHFLYAGHYLQYVQGLKPDINKHNTELNIEPFSGIPLKGAKRFQINIVFRKSNGLESLDKVSPALFPVAWLEESVELPDKFIEEFKGRVVEKLHLMHVFQWTFLGLTFGSTISCAFLFIYKKYSSK